MSNENTTICLSCPYSLLCIADDLPRIQCKKCGQIMLFAKRLILINVPCPIPGKDDLQLLKFLCAKCFAEVHNI